MVGDEDLVAVAVDVDVGEGELGAGVGLFFAHEHPGPFGTRREVDQVGDLGHLTHFALFGPVRRDRGAPTTLGDRDDHPGQLGGEVLTATEPDHALGAGVEEGAAAARRVGAHDHLGLLRVDRQLEEGLVEDPSVVGGRPRPGVPRAQQPRQVLARGVEVGEQGIEAEAALVGGGGLLFL